MDFINLIWIFLVVVSLVPMVRQRLIESARVRLLRQLEEKRGSRVIALIHRQESMSLLGFPMARYIDIQDSEQVLRAIKMTDDNVPIDLILHTPGGLVLAAEQIANALCKHPGKVTVFVPHYAMSGGTMIALSANEIVMDENAVLGPVDPQIGNYPAVSILSVLDKKDPNEIDDQTMILADISRKAIRQVTLTIQRIASSHYGEEQASRLAEELAAGHWTHDYPITVEEGQALGLKITTGMPTEIYQLMNLYPQASAHRPSVEYIPVPYPNRPALPSSSEPKSR
ncbi:MAG: ATP-dependent Clp protease proteolytic subunit [Anaerolineaceae bacterium]|jgi:ClpP class serine protease|nr:ATP-dependent Clp protease proteolytic subunit [Anaerolineaceae bacterium]